MYTYVHTYIDKMLSRKLQIFSSIFLVACSYRAPVTQPERISPSRDACTRTHAYVRSRIFAKLAKAIYEDPRVKAAIRRRHGASADKSTPRIWILCILQQCRFPGIVISAREYVFVNLREILDWRAKIFWNRGLSTQRFAPTLGCF